MCLVCVVFPWLFSGLMDKLVWSDGEIVSSNGSNHVSFVPLWIGLDSLFSQGKPLADGYYTRHPENCTERK